MNPRIQQLLKQATEDIMGVDVVNHAKFAELIINECVSRCEGVFNQPPEYIDSEIGNDGFYAVAAFKCMHAIQQLGVK
jgi:hypothetical protein